MGFASPGRVWVKLAVTYPGAATHPQVSSGRFSRDGSACQEPESSPVGDPVMGLMDPHHCLMELLGPQGLLEAWLVEAPTSPQKGSESGRPPESVTFSVQPLWSGRQSICNRSVVCGVRILSGIGPLSREIGGGRAEAGRSGSSRLKLRLTEMEKVGVGFLLPWSHVRPAATNADR